MEKNGKCVILLLFKTEIPEMAIVGIQKNPRGLVSEPLQNTSSKGGNERRPTARPLQGARLCPPVCGPGLTLLCRDPMKTGRCLGTGA